MKKAGENFHRFVYSLRSPKVAASVVDGAFVAGASSAVGGANVPKGNVEIFLQAAKSPVTVKRQSNRDMARNRLFVRFIRIPPRIP